MTATGRASAGYLFGFGEFEFSLEFGYTILELANVIFLSIA